MQDGLARVINIAGLKSKCDTQCKKMLAQKKILARILKGVTEEFRNMSLEEIEQCIEGVPEISVIPVMPGETNNSQILGLSNEDKVIDEGTVYFDIRTFVYIPLYGERVKIIMNIEAQKEFRPGYEIVTRGVFYGSRLISSQHGVEFVKSEYDSIKKVYSIWICMEAPRYIGNSITEFGLAKRCLFGNFPVKKKAYDKISVVVVTLNEKSTENNELTGLLNLLFSTGKTTAEKKKELQEKYQIWVDEELEQEVDTMCNYSELVEERGIEKGLTQVAALLLRQGKLSLQEIIEVTGMEKTKLEELKRGQVNL